MMTVPQQPSVQTVPLTPKPAGSLLPSSKAQIALNAKNLWAARRDLLGRQQDYLMQWGRQRYDRELAGINEKLFGALSGLLDLDGGGA